MRKSILFSLLCLVSVLAVACGGGNNAAGGGNGAGNGAAACGGGCAGGETTDAWATYRKDGRSWTHEMTGGMKMTTTIKNVTDNGCDMVTQMYGADGKEMGAANTTPMKFETAAATDTKVETPKSTEKEVECKAGKFESISYDDGKTWMMKKYPGIIVKSETMELVEFKE